MTEIYMCHKYISRTKFHNLNYILEMLLFYYLIILISVTRDEWFRGPKKLFMHGTQAEPEISCQNLNIITRRDILTYTIILNMDKAIQFKPTNIQTQMLHIFNKVNYTLIFYSLAIFYFSILACSIGKIKEVYIY